MINNNDILFLVSPNKSVNNQGVINLVCKMVILNFSHSISLKDLGKWFSALKMGKINLFSIDKDISDIHTVKDSSNPNVRYVEMNIDNFIKILNNKNNNFLNYNKHSLYIFRGGNFLDIKNLFFSIENCPTNIGRGGSQKAHMLSTLDLRLSTYLLAMFNFNYGLVKRLNAFDCIDKSKYLSYMDKTYDFVSIWPKNFYPILINKMPDYSKNHLDYVQTKYNSDCDLSCKVGLKGYLE